MSTWLPIASPCTCRACRAAPPPPSGLAAGFDKDAQVIEAMMGLGFGFVEVGMYATISSSRLSNLIGTRPAIIACYLPQGLGL